MAKSKQQRIKLFAWFIFYTIWGITVESKITKLSPKDDVEDSLFGYDVAISKEFAIIAAPRDGSIYIYKYHTNTKKWDETQKIYPLTTKSTTNTTHYSFDDWSVSIFKNHFIFGGANLSQAFIFKLNDFNTSE